MSLVAVNLKQFHSQTSSDFYALDGWPFAFFNEGGFAHDTRFIWLGLFGNLFVALFIGLAIGASWNRLATRRLR